MSDLSEVVNAIQNSRLSDQDKSRLSDLMRLLEKPFAAMTADERVAARVAAGLSAQQARRLLEMTQMEFDLMENVTDVSAHFTPKCLEKVDLIYGTGGVTQVAF